MSRSPAHASRRRAYLSLALLLGGALLLDAVPLWWGLPSRLGWAFDEILPPSVLEASRHLLNGWADRYPPLHYYLLMSIWSPLLAALRPLRIATQAADRFFLLSLVGRSLSVLMATTTVYLLYRTARLAYDRSTATLAALTCAAMAPFVYYAKTMNLEAPYLFWFSASLWFLVRVLRRPRWGDTLALAATTACTICTKDQTYALYLAVPVLLVLSSWRHRRARGEDLPLWRAALEPRLLAGGVIALALFALVHRIGIDPRALPRHIHFMFLIAAPAVEFQNTLAGNAGMLVQTLWNAVFALSVPLFAVCVVGVVRSLRRRPGAWPYPELLWMAAGYYLGFICVARYTYVRFMLPVAILLALFGAPVLKELGRWRPRGLPAGRALLVAILAYAILRAVAVDVAMLRDSRYAAERWLATHTAAGEQIYVVGHSPKLLPRGYPRLGWKMARHLLGERRPQLAAEYLVVNPDAGEKPRDRRTLNDLVAGRLGYRVATRFEPGPWWRLLDRRGARTNLVTVDPEIVVLRRDPGTTLVAPAAPEARSHRRDGRPPS